MRRSYLSPKGEGRIFARDGGSLAPQFVPGEEYKAQPLGSAEAQVAEAMAVAKEANSKESLTLEDRIATMQKMNPATAVDFLDKLSQYEREQYLTAEKFGKSRKTVLGRYGWSQ